LNQIADEGLFEESQNNLMWRMLIELLGMLDEFEGVYFGD